MDNFFVALAIITISASLIKLVKNGVWWIRFFDFPQSQALVIGYISFVGLLIAWDFEEVWQFIFLGILLVALVYETIIIFPYTYFAKHESKQAVDAEEEDKLSLMICNVYMYNTCYPDCVELIRSKDPDMLVLVETDLKWQKMLEVIESDYPFHVKFPLDNTYGILIYSKLELINPEVKFLVEPDVPSVHTHVRLRNGKHVKLYAVHPKPPSPTQNEESTERDAELYLIAKEVEHVKSPVIVAGDLNDVAWSRSTRIFQRISRLLDPRKGRGFFNTFHAKYPILRWPLDHIFHSGEFELLQIMRLPDIGSDHFPMFIQLAYKSGQDQDPDVEPADEEDREEAEEKIAAVL